MDENGKTLRNGLSDKRGRPFPRPLIVVWQMDYFKTNKIFPNLLFILNLPPLWNVTQVILRRSNFYFFAGLYCSCPFLFFIIFFCWLVASGLINDVMNK